MSRTYADPWHCPDCGATIEASPSRCTRCDLPLQGPVATELFATLRRADGLLAELRDGDGTAPAPAAGGSAAPEPPVATDTAPTPAAPPPEDEPSPADAPPPEDATPPSPEEAATAPPPGPEPATAPDGAAPGGTGIRWSVPAVLLTLGGLCLAVGAIVFLAVTWAQLGVAGRTAILVLLTAAAGAGATVLARRALRGAAETLAGLTAVLFTLDLAGGFAAGWFGSADGLAPLWLSGSAVLVATLGVGLLLRCDGARLATPQLAAVLAGTVTAAAAVVDSPATAVTLGAAAAAALAVSALGLRSDQRLLRWGAVGLAGVLWGVLVLLGLSVAGAVLSGRPGSVSPEWMVAGVLGVLVALLPGPVLGAGHAVRTGAGVAGLWCATVALLLQPGLHTATAATVVTTAVATATAGAVLVLARRSAAPGEPWVAVPAVLRLVAVSAGAVAALSALVYVATLAFSVVAGVVDAEPRWSATYPLHTTDHAPWIPLMGAVAGVALAVGATRTLPPRPLLAGLAAVAVVLTGVGLVPWLVLPAGVAALLALAAAVLALRTSRDAAVPGGPLPAVPLRPALWVLAATVGLLAAWLTSFLPELLLLTLAAATAVAVATSRLGAGGERPVAAAGAPLLLAATGIRAGTLAGVADAWLPAVVGVAVLALGVALLRGGWTPTHGAAEVALHAGTGAAVLVTVLALLGPVRPGPVLLLSAAVATYAAWLCWRDDHGPGVAGAVLLLPAVATAALSGLELTGVVPGRWESATTHLLVLAVAVTALLAGRARPVLVSRGVLAGAVLTLGVTGLATLAGPSGPGLAVTAGTAVVAVPGLRWSRPEETWLAAVVAPPLVAGAGWFLVAVLGGAGPWRDAAALVAGPVVVLGALLSGWGRRAAAPQPHRWAAYALLGVAAAAGAAHGTATADLLAHARPLPWLAAYLTIAGATAAVLGVAERNRWLAGLAAGLGMVALWVRLVASDVTVPEAYTVPLALVVLTFGGWVFRRDPTSRSLVTLGPGLGLGLLPSLVYALEDPVSLRALLLGLCCVVLVGVGALRGWQAPLLLGALAGAVLVVREVLPYQGAVPRWVLISAAGIVLLLAGIRWEQLATLGRRTWGRLLALR